MHCRIDPYTQGGVGVSECLHVHSGMDDGSDIVPFHPRYRLLGVLKFLTGDNKGLLNCLIDNRSDDDISTYLSCGSKNGHLVRSDGIFDMGI